MSKISRRDMLKESAVAAGTVGVMLSQGGSQLASAADAARSNGSDQKSGPTDFASDWHRCHDRVWLGADYWANPQQDWRIANGRAECVNAAFDRNVHVLTRQLGDKPGELTMSVRAGRTGGKLPGGKGSFGFRVGIQGPLKEYRNSLLYGPGLNAGVTAAGGLFVGDMKSAKPGTVKLPDDAVELRLSAKPAGDAYTVTLSAHGPDGAELGKVTRDNVKADQLVGNIALVSNFGSAARPRQQQADPNQPNFGTGSFWFADLKAGGSKLDRHDDHAFGPILWSQYTLHDRILKLTAQMPPVGAKESQAVRLETQDPKTGQWSKAGEAKIHEDARTAEFRIEKWSDTQDVPYRLVYSQTWTDGKSEDATWGGTIRKNPVDKPEIVVADVSCNGHQAFPNHEYVAKVAQLEPDVMAFVGDQFYESSGGYGVVRKPVEPAILDYLRKWYLHGWTWRELTRDRPSLDLPDDHDVYHGNIWGESGAPRTGTVEAGGFDMDPRWVNVVYRTHTSHHPDPIDATPVKQGITQYYSPFTYGRISFAVLADRMYKSAPEGKVPPTGGRGDHVKDMKFDPKVSDLPNLNLLGDRQTKFLADWAADWRGADMKGVISQTIFTAMATTHGGERMLLRADYDANGWPQTPRNQALREIRKAFAVHIAGDQHLPAVIQYGIDDHRDAGVAFAGPAVNVTYPRWWEPTATGRNLEQGKADLTGNFTDHFGHPLTVLAVKNGEASPRKGLMENLIDKASGLGVVRFNKPARTITFECWAYDADVTKPNSQMPGWPVTVNMVDNYARKTVGKLPAINMKGNIEPVVQVLKETDKGAELVYSLRPTGNKFEPFVFEQGRYTVRVGNPDLDQWREFKNLEPVAAGQAKPIDVEV